MSITGCAYGVHPFEFSGSFGSMWMHIHECPECGATYIREGADGCGDCVPDSRVAFNDGRYNGKRNVEVRGLLGYLLATVIWSFLLYCFVCLFANLLSK